MNSDQNHFLEKSTAEVLSVCLKDDKESHDGHINFDMNEKTIFFASKDKKVDLKNSTQVSLSQYYLTFKNKESIKFKINFREVDKKLNLLGIFCKQLNIEFIANVKLEEYLAFGLSQEKDYESFKKKRDAIEGLHGYLHQVCWFMYQWILIATESEKKNHTVYFEFGEDVAIFDENFKNWNSEKGTMEFHQIKHSSNKNGCKFSDIIEFFDNCIDQYSNKNIGKQKNFKIIYITTKQSSKQNLFKNWNQAKEIGDKATEIQQEIEKMSLKDNDRKSKILEKNNFKFLLNHVEIQYSSKNYQELKEMSISQLEKNKGISDNNSELFYNSLYSNFCHHLMNYKPGDKKERTYHDFERELSNFLGNNCHENSSNVMMFFDEVSYMFDRYVPDSHKFQGTLIGEVIKLANYGRNCAHITTQEELHKVITCELSKLFRNCHEYE
eukprot:gene12376-6044_t